MSTLPLVIFYSLIGGLFSLVGGVILLSSKARARNLATYATPFAAGALLAAAFLDLLAEAIHSGEGERALMFALIGILIFFLMERFLRWFHHHHDDEHQHTDPEVPLIIIGDTLHNFIDGIAIAAGFLVSPSTGIVVTIAVAAHEIPQEIGDFGLLLSKGMKPMKVLAVNAVSALTTTLAAVIFFQLGADNAMPLDILLGLVAGFFIYIAVSDIIPSIHRQENTGIAGPQTALLIVGVVVVGLMTTMLHGVIDQAGDSVNDQVHSQENDRSADD